MKAASPDRAHTSRWGITRFDRAMLGYGAICGFSLMLYASSNPVLAIILGIPPGILSFGIPMLVSKRFVTAHHTLVPIPIHKQRRIVIHLTVALVGLLGYRALIGDWFGLACTVMLAGAISISLAYRFGILQSFPAS